MKKIYKIALTAITTAMLSVSAFAGPAPHSPRDVYAEKKFHHAPPKPAHNWQHQNGHKPMPPRHPAPHVVLHQTKHVPAHAQKWHVQHKLPKLYQSSAYKVSSYQRHNLSKPNRNQQWYKVDGHYLLTDTKNHTILKVVRG